MKPTKAAIEALEDAVKYDGRTTVSAGAQRARWELAIQRLRNAQRTRARLIGRIKAEGHLGTSPQCPACMQPRPCRWQDVATALAL